MNKQIIAQEALNRATSNQSESNYDAIFEGFMDKGISPNDIHPRENVFTYHAWRAKGRQVRKGEHGVKIITMIPVKDKETGKQATDGDGRPKFRAKRATVFHISQTDPIQ